ncbi:MAG TPA: hypothetical protein VFP76_02065 [Gemmatimonadota bacterium]|nr:hypothetical protein [Gemmatimonadota bacterium]
MARSAAAALRELKSLKDAFGKPAAARKLELLGALEGSALATARQVADLHDLLCYWRAYPDGNATLAVVERMLGGFDRRPDLRRFRRELDDSGIAGTALHFPFFWPMAVRILERWPDRIAVDWTGFGKAPELEKALHLLVPYAETVALDGTRLPPKRWLQLLKGPGETDAAFLIRRFAALPAAAPVTERLYDSLDVPIRLSPGPDTPARTREKWAPARVVFQKRTPSRTRPALRQAVRRVRFEVRSLSPREGATLIELANAAMVPRHRDLLVFLHGDERDVRLVDFGDGLQFAMIGAKPAHRLVLEAVYGFLTLRNGVPVGYLLNSALFGSCELAYNVFETFRGAETARIYGRFVAAVSRLFGADHFTIDPYQLGLGNQEGLRSGAWWFYYKLGFRPRTPEARALVREELAMIRADRSHRTSWRRLKRLAAANLFYELGRPRPDVLGRVATANVGLRVSGYLTERFGSDRERGVRTCSVEAARLLGVRDVRRLSADERTAWARWSPLVLILPGIERWSAADRRALVSVIRAKAGRRESDYVRLFDRHRRLRRAILDLAEAPPGKPSDR